jgi:hypothetical protein
MGDHDISPVADLIRHILNELCQDGKPIRGKAAITIILLAGIVTEIMEDHVGAECLDPGYKLVVYSLQVLLIICPPPHIAIDLGPICGLPIGVAKTAMQDIPIVLEDRPRPISVVAVGIDDGKPLPLRVLT